MKKFIGPLIFALVAIVLALWHYLGSETVIRKQSPSQPVTINAFVGGEKTNFLNNPEVIELLSDRYGIRMNAVKAGSIEMVTGLPLQGKDVLWPSNQIAVEMFRKRGGHILADENIFNSPIVLYTYDIVAQSLIDQKIVAKKGEIHYIENFPKLIQYIRQQKEWKDIGLPQLFGKIAVHSTDPTRSNSGNMFAGLLANMYNQEAVITRKDLEIVLPDIKAYFSLRGYMEHSSSDIFKNFITTGVGAKPIIVGYENQLVEFSIENSQHIDYLRKKIRTLYPVPTVWSSHPILALTRNGKRLIEAMKDKEIQAIAWEKHGFRSGLIGVENDPVVLKIAGIPKEITAVIPLPNADVMESILNALQPR